MTVHRLLNSGMRLGVKAGTQTASIRTPRISNLISRIRSEIQTCGELQPRCRLEEHFLAAQYVNDDVLTIVRRVLAKPQPARFEKPAGRQLLSGSRACRHEDDHGQP